MAWSVTELASANDTTNVQTHTTASITTVAGRLYIVHQGIAGATGAAAAAPTGAGLTCTLIARRGYQTGSSPNRAVVAWWGIGSGTGAVTLDSGAVGCTGELWRILEITGHDPAATSPIVQSATNFDDTTTATSLTMTFSNPVTTSNAVMALLALNAQVTPTAGSGFTLTGGANNMGLPSASANAEYNLTPSGTTAVFNFAAGQTAGGIAFEIAQERKGPVSAVPGQTVNRSSVW